jgi:hypothetical protein
VLWGDRLRDGDVRRDEPAIASSSDVHPLLTSATRRLRADDGATRFAIETGPALDVYLHDHTLDGVPVMPMVVAMELMAEAASICRGGACASISDFRVLQGITYPAFATRTLNIDVGHAAQDSDGSVVSIASSAERQTLHYRGIVTCRRALDPPPRLERARLVDAAPLALSVDQAYQQWLFHGPRFAGITGVDAVGDNGIVGRVRPCPPPELLGRDACGNWLIDPVAIDSGLQLVVLWARARLDETPLPSRLRSCRRYVDVLPPEIVCEALVERVPRSATLVCDIRFFDAEHRLLVRLEGMEVTCSATLNRLSDAKPAGAVVS